jgi:hypothetical protein
MRVDERKWYEWQELERSHEDGYDGCAGKTLVSTALPSFFLPQKASESQHERKQELMVFLVSLFCQHELLGYILQSPHN